MIPNTCHTARTIYIYGHVSPLLDIHSFLLVCRWTTLHWVEEFKKLKFRDYWFSRCFPYFFFIITCVRAFYTYSPRLRCWNLVCHRTGKFGERKFRGHSWKNIFWALTLLLTKWQMTNGHRYSRWVFLANSEPEQKCLLKDVYLLSWFIISWS